MSRSLHWVKLPLLLAFVGCIALRDSQSRNIQREQSPARNEEPNSDNLVMWSVRTDEWPLRIAEKYAYNPNKYELARKLGGSRKSGYALFVMIPDVPLSYEDRLVTVPAQDVTELSPVHMHDYAVGGYYEMAWPIFQGLSNKLFADVVKGALTPDATKFSPQSRFPGVLEAYQNSKQARSPVLRGLTFESYGGTYDARVENVVWENERTLPTQLALITFRLAPTSPPAEGLPWLLRPSPRRPEVCKSFSPTTHESLQWRWFVRDKILNLLRMTVGELTDQQIWESEGFSVRAQGRWLQEADVSDLLKENCASASKTKKDVIKQRTDVIWKLMEREMQERNKTDMKIPICKINWMAAGSHPMTYRGVRVQEQASLAGALIWVHYPDAAAEHGFSLLQILRSTLWVEFDLDVEYSWSTAEFVKPSLRGLTLNFDRLPPGSGAGAGIPGRMDIPMESFHSVSNLYTLVGIEEWTSPSWRLAEISGIREKSQFKRRAVSVTFTTVSCSRNSQVLIELWATPLESWNARKEWLWFDVLEKSNVKRMSTGSNGEQALLFQGGAKIKTEVNEHVDSYFKTMSPFLCKVHFLASDQDVLDRIFPEGSTCT